MAVGVFLGEFVGEASPNSRLQVVHLRNAAFLFAVWWVPTLLSSFMFGNAGTRSDFGHVSLAGSLSVDFATVPLEVPLSKRKCEVPFSRVSPKKVLAPFPLASARHFRRPGEPSWVLVAQRRLMPRMLACRIFLSRCYQC